ncbi:hypothetical protein OUY22_16060, partial [Nonomuraea sp. MCN248]|nr:hypothetical protein [Nonomuraea corallina]
LVVGVGAGAVALTNMSGSSGSPVETTAAAQDDPAPVDEPTPTKPTKRPPKPSVTRQAETPPVRQQRSPTPRDTEEPEESPTPTITPTDKPSSKPSSASPSPKPKKPVPYVVDLPYPQAKTMIENVGFKVAADDQTGGKVKHECLKVAQSWPDGGVDLQVGKTVKVVLIQIDPCGSAPPSPTTTPVPKD